MWVMYLFAAAVGIVSAGLVGSLWLLLFNERLYFHNLFLKQGWLSLLTAMAAVYNAPILLFETGMAWAAEGRAAGGILILLAAGWSFLQGVFILTQVFGFT
jgi:hypothetical protein